MENILKKYAEGYCLTTDNMVCREDEQKIASSPVIFVFIGDKSKEALEAVYEDVNKKWDNSKGIMFFNVYHKEKFQAENVFNFKAVLDDTDIVEKKAFRCGIADNFYKNENGLIALNEEIMKMKNKLLECGTLFNSFERVNISVVSRADDAMNILVAEISLLIKNKFSQHFRIVLADFYGLLVEKNQEDAFFDAALAYSFFKELSYMQKSDFTFKEDIEVFGSDRKLPVINENKPIFDLVYLLSDTNEKGIISSGSLLDNYEIISYISLIKNRNVSIDTYYDMENQYYDNARFKKNISRDNESFTLVTAGLAKIKRPNSTVALMAVNAFYDELINKMKQCSNKNKEDFLKVFMLDDESLGFKASRMLPKDKSVEDMRGIMVINSNISVLKLGKLTLREAEQMIYGNSCEHFFNENFESDIDDRFVNISLNKELRDCVKLLIEDEKYGLYGTYSLTNPLEALQDIRLKCVDIDKNIEAINQETYELYNKRVQAPSLFKSLFSANAVLNNIKKDLFKEVYVNKLYILKLKIAQRILRLSEDVIISVHEELEEKINYIESIKKCIEDYANNDIVQQNEYIAQNIREYYTVIINKIVNKLSECYGENFYFQEKFLGDINKFRDDKKQLIEKLCDICNSYILCESEFSKSFEDELNERANVSLEFIDNNVLSKDELYKRLYGILEENSFVKAYIMNYNVNKYEEKYFFGDYSSDFIKYAVNVEREGKSYNIGYVHEKRASGIEKLNLMGGFTLGDVIYIKNAARYYNSCIDNGYKLHRIDASSLPDI
ncbi:hypothetical protein K9O30_05530 [Clostridium bowmanii]|uniref:hypothetical protein n=1 Tax=Clostridium bowmanii TaxID=132925 RepID=UPI001C0CE4E6|nr:hypothetical protein [Clostridium bowmanii]MBU3191640.1 hypothetical protein [Clostridium bowmanii]MCA1073206.1 hypothetical protein [Clostridium bowmanii]